MIKRVVRKLGYEIVRPETLNGRVVFKEFGEEDHNELDTELFRQLRPYTMTSRERVYALTQAVEYVCRQNVPGAVVECGVWKGGSMMAVALTLLYRKAAARDLYLFDTFQGMSAPGVKDENAAHIEWARDQTATHNEWCYAPIDEVRSNLASTGYDMSRVHFVPGRVEDTVPRAAPQSIALLRLDTDWYESTHHSLEHLFPRLSRGGVLIIDDYGGWEGCRRAVQEWRELHNPPILLLRIDHTARAGVKV